MEYKSDVRGCSTRAQNEFLHKLHKITFWEFDRNCSDCPFTEFYIQNGKISIVTLARASFLLSGSLFFSRKHFLVRLLIVELGSLLYNFQAPFHLV